MEADTRLRDWFVKDIKPNFKDAHVAWSFRNQADQEIAFKDHKSDLEWPDSAHNKMNGTTPCARALDLFQLIDHQGVWNPKWFYEINSYNEKHGIQLKWGGRFRTLGDNDHFELIN